MFDLSGKVAIVTGGNGGIGLGMARGLAAAGATLVIAARDRQKSQNAVRDLENVVRLPVTITNSPIMPDPAEQRWLASFPRPRRLIATPSGRAPNRTSPQRETTLPG